MCRTLLCIAATFLVAGCGDKDVPQNAGSQSNWLERCDRDETCVAGLSCLCGVCSMQCVDDSACHAVSEDATCAKAGSQALTHMCGGAAEPSQGMCVALCSAAGADCGPAPDCDAGGCQPTATPDLQPDAGADDLDALPAIGMTAADGGVVPPAAVIPAGDMCPPEASIQRPSVCPSRDCGNGVQDTCTQPDLCDQAGGCPDIELTEECDGDAFGSDSCMSRGYLGGAPGCFANCRLDTSACQICQQHPQLHACRRFEVGYVVLDTVLYPRGAVSTTGAVAPAHALAAGPSEIGLAWLPREGQTGDPFLRVTLLSEDLSVVAASDCAATHGWARAPTMARTATGWVVAVAVHGIFSTETHYAFEIYALDERLQLRSEPWTISVPQAEGGRTRPKLVARAGAGPLLLYGRKATLLDDDGNAQWTSSPGMPSMEFVTDEAQAAYTEDGFVYAVRVRDPATGQDTLRVVRLELDGTISGSHTPAGSFLVGMDDQVSQLSWTGDSALLVYDYESPQFLQLDRDAQPLGPPVEVDFALSQRAMVGLGDELLVASQSRQPGDPNPAVELALERVGTAGAASGTPVHFSTVPNGVVRDLLPMADGSVVVAWSSFEIAGDEAAERSLYLARVTPE